MPNAAGFYIYDEFDYSAQIDDERSRKYYNTGYPKVDRLARPRSGEITMIPAFTDHGKSSFLRNIAYNIYKAYPTVHSLYYAFEEQAVDTYTALVRLEYFDKFEKHMPERMSPEDFWGCITRKDEVGCIAIGLQAQMAQRIHVSEKRVKPSEIGGHILSIMDKFPIEVVFIDYLQDMKPERQINNAPAELEDMIECVEDVTKEHNIATLIAAQYRPDAKQPDDKWDIVGLTRVFGSSSAYKKAKLFMSLFNETAFKRVFKNGEQNPLVQKLEIDILKQKRQRYGKNLCLDMCSLSNRITESADYYEEPK